MGALKRRLIIADYLYIFKASSYFYRSKAPILQKQRLILTKSTTFHYKILKLLFLQFSLKAALFVSIIHNTSTSPHNPYPSDNYFITSHNAHNFLSSSHFLCSSNEVSCCQPFLYASCNVLNFLIYSAFIIKKCRHCFAYQSILCCRCFYLKWMARKNHWL